MHVAEFIAKNYYHDDSLDGIDRVQSLLSVPGVFFEKSPDDSFVLVYLTLSDEGLALLKDVKTESDFKNGLSDTLLQYPGHHIYVFRMVAESRPSLKDLKIMRDHIIKKHNAVSFSWHDDHRVILHTYEV